MEGLQECGKNNLREAFIDADPQRQKRGLPTATPIKSAISHEAKRPGQTIDSCFKRYAPYMRIGGKNYCNDKLDPPFSRGTRRWRDCAASQE